MDIRSAQVRSYLRFKKGSKKEMAEKKAAKKAAAKKAPAKKAQKKSSKKAPPKKAAKKLSGVQDRVMGIVAKKSEVGPSDWPKDMNFPARPLANLAGRGWLKLKKSGDPRQRKPTVVGTASGIKAYAKLQEARS
jgi:primosomal protein N'